MDHLRLCKNRTYVVAQTFFVFQHSFDLSEAYSDEMELFVEIKQSLGEHADVLDGCKASGVSFV
jgi:hypothetical protein